MKKLHTVIVDDDYLIIQNLQKLIDWDKLGFEISHTASNGQDALKYIRKNHPHVLITDIIMPAMDGLTLISHVRKEFPDMKILILSSYDEFGYVKKAIEAGVTDYILKSEITEISFSAKLSQIYQQCFSERHLTSAAINKELAHYFETGSPLSDAAQLRYLNGIYQKEYLFFIFSQAVSFETDPAAALSTWESSSLFLYSVIPEIEDFRNASILFTWRHYCILGVVLETGRQNRRYLIDSISRKSLYYVNSRAPHPCALFYGYRPLTPEKLLHFFKINQNALEFYCHFPDTHPFTFEQIEADFTKQYIREQFDFQSLSMTREHLEDDILSMRDFLSRCFRHKDAQAISSFFQKIATLFVPDSSPAYFQTPEYFEKWVFNVYETHVNRLSSKGDSAMNASTSNAIRFIEQNFSNCDLSVRDICEHVSLSVNRLGVIFKGDTGKTINEYLTDVRIRNAEFLLNNTNMKIYEISDKCGYKSSQYFSQIFYQKTGRRPIDYRRNK